MRGSSTHGTCDKGKTSVTTVFFNERDLARRTNRRFALIIFFHTPPSERKDQGYSRQLVLHRNSLKRTMNSFTTKFLDEAFADDFLPSCGPSSGKQSSLYSKVFGACAPPKIVNDRDDVNSTRKSVSGNHRGSDKPSTRRSASGTHRGSGKQPSTLSNLIRQTLLGGGHQRQAVLARSGGQSRGMPSGSRAGLPSGL